MAIEFVEKVFRHMPHHKKNRKQVFLCHLSKENNSVETVHDTVLKKFKSQVVKTKSDPIPRLEIKKGSSSINMFIVRRDTTYKGRL